MKYQAIVVPNGLIAHLSGPFCTPQNNCGVCQGTTCFPLRKHLGVFPTLTLDTFSILWTPTASQFWRRFAVLLAVSNTTMHSFHSNPLSNTPSEGCSETSTSSKSSLETSSDSALSDPNSALMFFGDSPSRSGDRAAPMASNIKGHIVKVIHNIKG